MRFWSVGLEHAPKFILIRFGVKLKVKMELRKLSSLLNKIHDYFPRALGLNPFYLYNDTAVFFFLVL